jgi:hypothetical protein
MSNPIYGSATHSAKAPRSARAGSLYSCVMRNCQLSVVATRAKAFPCRYPATPLILAERRDQAHDFSGFFVAGTVPENFFPCFPCAAGKRGAPRLSQKASIHADRGAEGVADRSVEHEIGDRIEAGRLAIDDHQDGAVALGELRKSGGRVHDQRRSGDDEEIGR